MGGMVALNWWPSSPTSSTPSFSSLVLPLTRQYTSNFFPLLFLFHSSLPPKPLQLARRTLISVHFFFLHGIISSFILFCLVALLEPKSAATCKLIICSVFLHCMLCLSSWGIASDPRWRNGFPHHDPPHPPLARLAAARQVRNRSAQQQLVSLADIFILRCLSLFVCLFVCFVCLYIIWSTVFFFLLLIFAVRISFLVVLYACFYICILMLLFCLFFFHPVFFEYIYSEFS